MINSREELIARAKKFDKKEEQIEFIMDYFLEHVEYNYAYLFAKGYAEGDISQVKGTYGLAINKTRAEGDSEFAITQSPAIGDSKIHNDILKIRDESNNDYDKFISELRTYITDVMNSHIDNDEIVSKSVDSIMNQIVDGLRAKTKIKYNDVDIECNNDISKVLIDFILKPRDYFPPEYRNGLIINGVCEDYTIYLIELFKELGIEAHNIGGTSELGHAWVIVNADGKIKSIDLTRAVFIRDGFKGIPSNQTSKDWLYTDLDKMFAMQEKRCINEIDGKSLEVPIDGQNYDENNFLELLKEQNKKEIKIKALVRNALENGVTISDVETVPKKQENNTRVTEKNDIDYE